MAAINDLIARIQNPELRKQIEKEVKDLTKQKKFGLVFENHIPEMTLLYDYPISRGCKVIRKTDDDKKLSEDILWEVKKISKGIATCVHTVTKEELHVVISDLICVAKNGEPIYPCLKFIDSIQKAPNSDLWHTLIEADNYHALQLLAYLYPGMVDCIYIDPPYNSGATDWKYNNNYVDGNDGYRHSKWLAMMKSRLLLAKKLLNPDNSVLIVTIDEKEYLHLGCLLEEIFPEAEGDKENNYKGRVSIQMVSDVINPKGVSRLGFRRNDEYIFFVMLGQCCPSKLPLGNEWSSSAMINNETKKTKLNPEWTSMMRRGSNSTRKHSPGCYYPIYVDWESKIIRKIGEPIKEGEKRGEDIEGLLQVLPLRTNGDEGCWQVSPVELQSRLNQGRIRLGSLTNYGCVINYLPDGAYQELFTDKWEIIGRESDGSIKAKRIVGEDDTRVAPTQWKISTHNASENGSTMISNILGSKRFSYPKSLYSEKDAIYFFTANNPNALILDFFAGSGTTLHAVNLMNREDGGHRRCIMVTNNEVSADEETAFRAKGLHKGDDEWEKYGIARYVNWPRTKCSIEGVDVNGQPINGEYITSNTQEITQKRSIKQLSFIIPNGKQGTNVKKQIVSLINDKKMPQNSVKEECPYIVKEDASTAILFDIDSIFEFFEEIPENIEKIYIVTTDDKEFKSAKKVLDELPERTKTVPVTIPMSDGFEANAAFYKLTFLDKEAVSLGSQLDKLLSILWMKAGAHGVCPTHVEGEYAVLPENKMAILIDEYAFDEMKKILEQHPEIETVYIIDDSEDNYRALAAQLSVKNTYQLYRDYLDNFKINIERR